MAQVQTTKESNNKMYLVWPIILRAQYEALDGRSTLEYKGYRHGGAVDRKLIIDGLVDEFREGIPEMIEFQKGMPPLFLHTITVHHRVGSTKERFLEEHTY
jgi:hypothetical protein